MKFCKILYHIFITIFRNYCYDEVGGVTSIVLSENFQVTCSLLCTGVANMLNILKASIVNRICKLRELS